MGEKTLNGYFYKPSIGAKGIAEKALYDKALDDTDALIKAVIDTIVLKTTLAEVKTDTDVASAISLKHDGSLQELLANKDTSTALGASDTKYPSQKAVKSYIDTAISAIIGVPSGVIAMWSGTIATIPTGWVLCDGNNSTPDLRDRFIVGAKQDDSGEAKTNVTGSLTKNGNGSIPQHSHGITGLSVANENAHTHTLDIIADGSGSLKCLTQVANGLTNKTTSAGSAHTHALSGSIDNYGTGSTNIAVYYALAFIMKS